MVVSHLVPMRVVRVLAGVIWVVWCGSAGAQPVTAIYPAPTLDRWMYPFNQASPLGSEAEATVFSPIGSVYQSSFDNRDGQLLIGFNTGPAIQPGLGTDRYRVIRALLTARTSRDRTFRYDPTQDPVASYYAPTDPAYVPDSDPGAWPLELFGVGYRNGFTPQTFQENSPHSPGPAFPNKRVRNAFAAQFDPGGGAVDASNNVDDRFEVTPFAVGTAALPLGALAPIDTDFTFSVSLGAGGAAAYLARGLDAGRVSLMITSLALTTQQSSDVPAFYASEFPASIGGVPARLELTVCVGARADWDCNGQVQPADVAAFVNDWFGDLVAGTLRADFDGNGAVQPADVAGFVSAWFQSL